MSAVDYAAAIEYLKGLLQSRKAEVQKVIDNPFTERLADFCRKEQRLIDYWLGRLERGDL